MPKPYEVELALRSIEVPHRSLPFIHGVLTCSAVTPRPLEEYELCAVIFKVAEEQPLPDTQAPSFRHAMELLYDMADDIFETLPEGTFRPYLGPRVSGATGMEAAREWCSGFVAASVLREEDWWEGGLKDTDRNFEPAFAFALLRLCAIPPDDPDDEVLRYVQEEFTDPDQSVIDAVEVLHEYFDAGGEDENDDDDTVVFDRETADFPEDAEYIPADDETQALPAIAADVPGRNAPCPCGSGKKYKKCCGKN
jgi:yecA family protein